jgi:hypothetical protein
MAKKKTPPNRKRVDPSGRLSDKDMAQGSGRRSDKDRKASTPKRRKKKK